MAADGSEVGPSLRETLREGVGKSGGNDVLWFTCWISLDVSCRGLETPSKKTHNVDGIHLSEAFWA